MKALWRWFINGPKSKFKKGDIIKRANVHHNYILYRVLKVEVSGPGFLVQVQLQPDLKWWYHEDYCQKHDATEFEKIMYEIQ